VAHNTVAWDPICDFPDVKERQSSMTIVCDIHISAGTNCDKYYVLLYIMLLFLLFMMRTPIYLFLQKNRDFNHNLYICINLYVCKHFSGEL